MWMWISSGSFFLAPFELFQFQVSWRTNVQTAALKENECDSESLMLNQNYNTATVQGKVQHVIVKYFFRFQAHYQNQTIEATTSKLKSLFCL